MENNTEEKIQVKAVDSSEDIVVTPQEKEAAVLEQAVESGEVSKDYGLQEDGVYKINVDKEPSKEKIMPFKSEKQRRFLWANEPEIAKKWTAKYGSNPISKQLPKKKKKKYEQTTDEFPLELIKKMKMLK